MNLKSVKYAIKFMKINVFESIFLSTLSHLHEPHCALTLHVAEARPGQKHVIVFVFTTLACLIGAVYTFATRSARTSWGSDFSSPAGGEYVTTLLLWAHCLSPMPPGS